MKEPIGIRDYTIHGTELAPFHIYHQNYIHGGLQVPFHWHKEIEIIWVEQGQLELTLGTVTNCISYKVSGIPHLFITHWYFFPTCSLFPIQIRVSCLF